ncbi:Fic family protein [Ornithinimicrobium cryptoxanthini]|uniref:Fic family protein n=1 Tax=Ornithinimicrobium cryptoxanthini TaxID=2934161 RepID=UPI0021184393|nr:Fic family protein [Ornithinimicrobium cryptoxanthini]
MSQSTGVGGQVQSLLGLPGVTEAVEEAREACTQLRWHQALRRRIPEAAAESRVRGSAATALLEGSEPAGSQGTVVLVRDLVRGAAPWPTEPDPVERVLKAAVQVTAATESAGPSSLASPAQLLARLHVAASADLLPPAQVGRPRGRGEACPEFADLGPAPAAEELPERLDALYDLLRSVQAGTSALAVAALAHAELVTVRPFVTGNGLVARALERVVHRVGGLDPTGVAVPELGHSQKVGADYRGALTAYSEGGLEGVRLWLLHCAEAAVTGAGAGTVIADAVLAGRLAPGSSQTT